MSILNNLFRIILTFLFVSLVSFVIIRLIPGDPVTHLLGERGATAERVLELKKFYGLDQPLLKQFQIYVFKVIQGDFGESTISRQPVMSEFKVLWPATFELAIAALFWASIAGVGLGILAAMKRNSFWDYTAVSISTVGFAMPIFWWALLSIFFFAVQLQWLPVSGRIGIEYDIPYRTGFYLIDSLLSESGGAAFLSAIKHLILPALILGTIPLAMITRVTRSSFIDVSKEDFIRTAKAKGLRPSRVVGKHILKNAFPQVLTTIGLSLGHLLTGAIITETIFSWPGIGRWLIKSIEARDYPVVQAGLFYSMLIIALTNFLVDFGIEKLNPRMRDSKNA